MTNVAGIDWIGSRQLGEPAGKSLGRDSGSGARMRRAPDGREARLGSAR